MESKEDTKVSQLRPAVPPTTGTRTTEASTNDNPTPRDRIRRLVFAPARAVVAWSRRPSGRLALPGLLLLALVSLSGSAGALLVPAGAPAAQPTTGATPSGDPDLDGGATPAAADAPFVPTAPPTAATPTATTPAAIPPNLASQRPSDVLAPWAKQISDRIGVPAAAMQAYGYAEWVVSQTTPECKLSWTTLAAIGQVESNHGRANGASLGPDGVAQPHIIGLPLDGKGNRKRILDTDQGRLDGDTTYDRAVGPMQFIPSTWRLHGADADNDGVKNPHDLDDAALAAANYLCHGGRDLTKPGDWWNAILSYNNVQSYARKVFDTADTYGRKSRTP